MVSLDHNTFGYLTFAFITLSVLSGAMILLSPRRSLWIKLHAILSVLAYILMFITLWLVL
ncbi:hypothetical protein [Thermococcus sp.]|uniref:hypothetical protein n=1 Tax=Thermococcus sp. TaxID=35749 RepID=UPI002610581A|nr:hypothetical protein [Thermococcus sp.]